MRLFKRSGDRKRTRRQYRPRLEALETRLCLACDLQLMGDGTLQILGDDAPQIVEIEDLGNGNVSVLCQDRGDERGPSRLFSGVAAIRADLKGGDDEFDYRSLQNVNEALADVEVRLGDGDDVGRLFVELSGTPDGPREFSFIQYGGAGNDVLLAEMNSFTDSRTSDQPVVHGEMHGGAGRDEMTLISRTSTGGFTLTTLEQADTRSQADGPVCEELPPEEQVCEPPPPNTDCLIWDLVDGTSGEVNARVMGSEADEAIELRSDERGIGRKDFNFLLDGGGGVNALNSYLTLTGETNGKVATRNGAEQTLRIDGIVELEATAKRKQSLYFPEHMLMEIRDQSLTFDFVGTDDRDELNIQVGESQLNSLSVNIDTRGGDDLVEIQYNAQQDESLAWIAQQSWNVHLGEGDDRFNGFFAATDSNIAKREPAPSDFSLIVHGGEGDDSLRTEVNSLTSSRTPTEPVLRGEMHGGAGRDELTLVSSTAAGGFELSSKELDSSVAGDPDCMIWDLIDGSSGEVNAQVMGSGANNEIELRSDERGVGRARFDIGINGGAGLNTVTSSLVVDDATAHGELRIENVSDVRLETSGLVELVAAAHSQAAIGAVIVLLELDEYGLEVFGFTQVALSLDSDDVSLDFAGTAHSQADGPVCEELPPEQQVCQPSPPLEPLIVLGFTITLNDDPFYIISHGDLKFAATGYDDVNLALDLKGHDTSVQIGLLLPAIQKVREPRLPTAQAHIDVQSSGAGNAIVVDAVGYPDLNGAFNLTGPDTSVQIGIVPNGGILVPTGNTLLEARRGAAAQARIDVLSSGAGNTIEVDAVGYPTFGLNLTAPQEPVKVVTVEYLVLGTFLALHASNFTGDVSLRGGEADAGGRVTTTPVGTFNFIVEIDHSSHLGLSGDNIVKITYLVVPVAIYNIQSVLVEDLTIDTREVLSVALHASNFSGGIAMQASQRLQEISLTLKDVELSGDMDVIVDGFRDVSRTIDGMHIHAGGSYRETIRAADDRQRLPKGFGFVTMSSEGMHIAEGGEFRSLLVGGRAADYVESRLVNVVNHGEFVQIVKTGRGADTMRQSLDGFANYGTATFDTRLGAGNDTYVASVSGLYVAPHAIFSMLIDGGAGQDTILAYTQATVDGHYRFEARGGRGDDFIDVVKKIGTNWRPNDGSGETDHRPAIDILLEGNDGNDWLGLDLGELDLLAHEVTHALVDGGAGRDTACVRGPVRVVNVEHFCRERDKKPVKAPGRVEFPNLVFYIPRAD